MNASRESWHVCGRELTLADCAQAPFLSYLALLEASSGRDWLSTHPQLARFWEGAQCDRVLAIVVQEILLGLARVRSSS